MPLFRRFGRPGLLGALAGTALVAGTATMTSRAINNGLDRRDQADAEAQAFEAQQAAPAAVTPTQSIAEQLQTIGDLHTAGQITDEEFTRAKSRILG